MTKLCQTCGKYPIFSKGLCKYCYLKANSLKQIKKVYKYTQAKQKAIKTVSDKRKTQLQEYERKKKEREIELKQEGSWKCLFCDTPFQENEQPSGGWHHLAGRENSLLTDFKYVFPAHRHCHIDIYHGSTFAVLSNQRWYKTFMEKLKEIDIELYNKELKKGTK